MLKKFFVIFAIALAAILVLCMIYLPSFSRYHELKQEEEKLNKRIREIDGQIRALADEKYLLQNDVAYLEKVIREELGFVKPGEIIYEMVTKKDAGKTAAFPSNSTQSVTQTNSTSSDVKASLQKKPTKTGSRTVRAPSAKTTSAKRSSR